MRKDRRKLSQTRRGHAKGMETVECNAKVKDSRSDHEDSERQEWKEGELG